MIRFFDINNAFKSFGCTYTASSASAISEGAFDELENTHWTSSGQGTDGTGITLDCDYGINREIDTVFIKKTNMTDATIQLWTGSAWITPTNYISVRSTKGDLYTYNIVFDKTTHSKIRIIGSNTKTPNEEKQVQDVYAFLSLGYLEIPPSDIKPKRVKEQHKHKLDNGRYYILDRGSRWEIELKFKSHLGQNDINLIESLVDRGIEFYMWINDDSEAIMEQVIKPFDFHSILKLSVDKGDKASYYKNLFFSGVDNTLKLIEVS